MFDTGKGFDWATAEALAFGSLLTEGYPCALRGRIQHARHVQPAAFRPSSTRRPRIAITRSMHPRGAGEVRGHRLDALGIRGARFRVRLFSLAEPNALVLWEAQFGDFANGAQIMFDQFISSGERKWLRMSGLVMLLPHGFEGQGPEHSSARLERFLQMCAEDNWIVANCTTPANYFHILRRQLHRSFRKPLVLMTPKSLLRHKLAVSDARISPRGRASTASFGTTRRKGIRTPTGVRRQDQARGDASGKVYFDLLEERDARGIDDVYLLRLEQFYPFPALALMKELERFKGAEMVWCQEEPKNQGAWSFVEPNIEWVLTRIGAKHTRPAMPGGPPAPRPPRALPASTKHNNPRS
jgi:2-oxoglutarate dehydrogenase E1 component